MPDRLVLGFDTSAAHCAAALLSGDRVIAQRHEPMAKGQAERLFPILHEVLDEAGAAWGDLAVIGVGRGPGNFTGVRISIAAARGLALSLGIPAIGVPVTEAAALDAPRPCRVILPARGDQVIWQDFDADGSPALGYAEALPPGPTLARPRWPLAVAIARIAASRGARPSAEPVARPAPIYLRPADAAPPRDTGPVILG